MIKYFFTIHFIITALWANNPIFINEELIYTAGFRFISAGEAKLSFTLDSLNGQAAYKLQTNIKTNTFVDKFYKIRDEIISWLKLKDLSLIKTIQTIHEGKYNHIHISSIQGDTIAINKNTSRLLLSKVYDPVSFIYFLRTQNLKIGDSYTFFSYGRKNIRKIAINILSEEIVSVPAGLFNCLKIEPISSDGRPLLKNEGEMRVWLNNDSLHLPIKIEQKTNLGNMVLKLKKINSSPN